MKKTAGIIIGLSSITLLCSFVGCSTGTNTGTIEPQTLAAKSTPPPMNTLTSEQNASGAVNNTSGSTTCCGSYTASAKITNSVTGTIWFTPPTGTTNGTITDSSGLSSPYVSVVLAMRKRDSVSWCGTNTVSFPAESTNQYKFFIYVKNTLPPPTNGQVLTLDVQWTP